MCRYRLVAPSPVVVASRCGFRTPASIHVLNAVHHLLTLSRLARSNLLPTHSGQIILCANSRLPWGVGSLFSVVCEGAMAYMGLFPTMTNIRHLTERISPAILWPLSACLCPRMNMTVLACTVSDNVTTEWLRFRGTRDDTAYCHNMKEKGASAS